MSTHSSSARANCPLHLWRKSASAQWLEQHAASLYSATAGLCAIIERPGRKRLIIEACCEKISHARALAREFGGSVRAVPRDWAKAPAHRPISVGRRMIVSGHDRQRDRNTLVIPAGAAFGTGEHTTTAMSLRMLERVTRKLRRGWSALDVGTGSGILALAAHRFGARRVAAIDSDAVAVRTARENARRNGIRGIRFERADVLRLRLAESADVITANLYSQLIIAALPRLRHVLAPNGVIILSGVLRFEEQDVACALAANNFALRETRRRGKWIALLASRRP